MVPSSHFNLALLVAMSIVLTPTFGYHSQKRDDGLCPSTRTVLCFKDVLDTILKSAQQINGIAGIIKQQIEQLRPPASMHNYAQHTMNSMRSYLPKSDHHVRFIHHDNNINRTGLINLLKEQSYAYSYVYNSIKSILQIENVFARSIDESFNTILHNIQKDILCSYHNIFYTYSESTVSVDDIPGILTIYRRKRNAPSVIHNSYSVIIVELINEWTNNVNEFAKNLESKLLL